MRRTALTGLLWCLSAGLLVGGLPSASGAIPEVCTPAPEPARWLAAENTLAAFEHAIAYDMDMIEVDVQQTADHRFVIFHDLDVAPKSDGTGSFPLLTLEQTQSFNVASNDKWRGSAYDPSRMPMLEDVLALAAEHQVGIMFDLKESVTDAATVALMARDASVVPRSVFIPYLPVRAEAIKAAVPEARLNFSTQGFSEAYDGCALVVPNVYQGELTGSEAGDLALARSLGADGAQVNNLDVAATSDCPARPSGSALAATHG